MGQNVPSHPGPIPVSHGTGMGGNFFSWDGMGPNLCGMGAPGPTPSQDQDRDGTRPWWDGSSHPGPAASLASRFISEKNQFNIRYFPCIITREDDDVLSAASIVLITVRDYQ